ncbi:MAG: 5-(carboxyamino)imidazole ribonucleotide synthase, partial [Ignavibacteriaceae bacterium]|nr:5-(carboxyamino)imidazole ribonucleotide synthase [Ignavibacteriaceae bacterium]
EILKSFSDSCDIITLENEFVDHNRLKFIENLGKKVVPSSNTIALIQDKLLQKRTLASNNIPVADFHSVASKNDYKTTSKKLGKRFILKSRKMGYDGYGNFLVKNQNDFEIGVQKLTARHSEIFAEKFVDFDCELAIMVLRTSREIKSYPVVETIQKNHICHTVIAPARVSHSLIKKVKEIAIESVIAVDGYGIFGIELFKQGNKIFVNEMAPRPHNSGHYTIDACVTSQFENHIRAVLNLPLGSTKMLKPFAVMINLLGKKNDSGIVEDYNKALKNENIHLHIYGKKQSRIGRKMGHITLTGNNLDELLKEGIKTEKQIII